MNKGVKKLMATALMCTLIVSMFAGCSKKEEETSADAGSDYTINLGYYNCDHMTAAPIAEKAGIYKKNGLNVKVTGNGKVPEAMAAGKMDAGYIGITGAYRATKKNVPLMVGANNHIGGSYYLVTSKDITDPKQLVGEKLGIGTEPETDVAWVEIARKLGIPAEGKNYQGLDFNSSTDAILALKTGKIKGFTTCDPWASLAEHEGAGKIFADFKGPGDQFSVCCTFTLNKNFVDKYPELAKKLVKSHVEAIKFMYTKPTEAAKIFAEAYKVPMEVALNTIHKKTVGEGRTITWEADRAGFDRDMAANKAIDPDFKDIKVEDLLKEDYIKSLNLESFNDFIKKDVDKNFPVGMKFEDWKKKISELGI
ncbi:MAG: ABC transporter substrate-binding subunit SaoX [Clostridium sp.]